MTELIPTLDDRQLNVINKLYTLYGDKGEHRLLYDKSSGKWFLMFFDTGRREWQVEYADTFRNCLDVIREYNAPPDHPF